MRPIRYLRGILGFSVPAIIGLYINDILPGLSGVAWGVAIFYVLFELITATFGDQEVRKIMPLRIAKKLDIWPVVLSIICIILLVFGLSLDWFLVSMVGTVLLGLSYILGTLTVVARLPAKNHNHK
jgi:hypothetical protein